MTPPEFIPFARPDIGEEEISAAAETLRSGWLTTGPQTAQFEEEFCRYTGAPHALAVNSGTAAMHLALVALGIGPGDEVITTPLTFCATVNVILQVGARPLLADIGADLNISSERIAALITPKTRAILPVHLAGLPCDLDAIWEIARAHNLAVVEDAAHAVGSQYKGVRIGAGSSDAVAFSFYATKNLATGEGGMVACRSAELDSRMRRLALHGMDRDAWRRYGQHGNWYYEVTDCGYKCNLSDLMSAIGRQQLRKLERMNARRAGIARRYNRAFAELTELELPPNRNHVRHTWQLYVLRLNLERLKITRDEFLRRLHGLGIGGSVHFIPIPLHPFYKANLPMSDPCARALAEYPRLVSLPLYPAMTDEQVERVIQAVRHIVANSRKSVQAVAPGG